MLHEFAKGTWLLGAWSASLLLCWCIVNC